MSLSLTIRRSDPAVIDGLSGEDAVAFCLALDTDRAVESEDVIDFFAPWHIVHYLSSGTEWDRTLPDGFMVGGTPWAQPHPDAEPFRILSAEEVRAVARHLAGLPEVLLADRLEALSTGTVPIYGGPVPPEAFGIAKAILDHIRTFVVTAADRGQVITMAMS